MPRLFPWVNKNMKYELHPACAAWPPMTPDALKELAEDIKANGLREPATLTPEGLLLDGRNRVEAGDIIGIDITTVIYDGDPVEFSISKNRHRRHLDNTALAFVGAELAKITRGAPEGNQRASKTEPAVAGSVFGNKTQEEIANDLNITVTSIDRAKAVRDKATPEVEALVKSGRVGLSTAAEYARNTPKEKQQADPKVIKKSGARKRQRAKNEAPVFVTKDLPQLTREEVGRPPAHLASQQHPDHPPGHTYDMVWIRENGSVHLRTQADAEQVKLRALFASLGIWLRNGEDNYSELAEKWQKLTARERLDFEKPLTKMVEELNSLKEVLNIVPITIQ